MKKLIRYIRTQYNSLVVSKQHFLIGFVSLPIILIVGTILISTFSGWINWENPFTFFNNQASVWGDFGIWTFIRTILSVSIGAGFLNIYIQKYLKDEEK